MESAPSSRAAVDLTVLGSSDAFCSGAHLHAAYLIRTRRSTFLLDCGPTILLALRQQGVDSEALDFVIISHLHGDHFAGLPFLLLEYTYERPRQRPLTIVGPPGMEARLWALFRAMYGEVAPTALPFPMEVRELQPEVSATVADVDVYPVQVPHQLDDVSLALRLSAGGTQILYSGDSPWIERFVELARGVDLFLCECTAYETPMGRHVEWRTLERALPRLQCRRLVLTHLGRAMREHAAELGVECATEGMRIEL